LNYFEVLFESVFQFGLVSKLNFVYHGQLQAGVLGQNGLHLGRSFLLLRLFRLKIDSWKVFFLVAASLGFVIDGLEEREDDSTCVSEDCHEDYAVHEPANLLSVDGFWSVVCEEHHTVEYNNYCTFVNHCDRVPALVREGSQADSNFVNNEKLEHHDDL